MQKGYPIFLMLFFIGTSFKTFSQNKTYPMVIDVGINDIDFSVRITDKPINNIHNVFLPRVGASWLVYNHFMANVSTSVNNISVQGGRSLFLSVDTEVEYAIFHPLLNKFVPSIYAGVGYNLTKNTHMLSANGGGVLKYWITDSFGVRMQAGVKRRIIKNNQGFGINHTYYAIGVLFSLESFKRGRKKSNWRNVDCN